MTDKELERAARALLAELERQDENHDQDTPNVWFDADLACVSVDGRVDLVALAAVLGPCAGGHEWIDATVLHSNVRTYLCSRCNARRRIKN